MRKAPDLKSKPMSLKTQERLIELASKLYPRRVRRAVDLCPVAVNHTVDNEADALETIRRMERRLA